VLSGSGLQVSVFGCLLLLLLLLFLLAAALLDGLLVGGPRVFGRVLDGGVFQRSLLRLGLLTIVVR